MDLSDKFERIRDVIDEVNDTLSDVLEDDDLEHHQEVRNRVRSFYEQMKRMESLSERLVEDVRHVHPE